jgi:nucleoporin NUP159
VENHVFLAVYTPNESEDENSMAPDSDYYIIQRRPNSPFLFRQLPLLCAPFGLKRTPAYQFITRLSNYDNLQDALVISSTASTDLGLVTRLTTPFKDADETSAGIFTTTSIIDDTRRAALPMNAESMETSTIGIGLDLTGTELVVYDVEKETKAPLPNIMVLTNEGVLSSWWFLYMKAIEAGLPYKAISTAGPVQQTPIKASPVTPAAGLAPAQNIQPAFGQSSFGQTGFGTPQPQPSAFGKPAAPSFGSPSSLGSAQKPAFGAPSSLGSSQKPAFGAPSTIGGGANFGSTTPNKSPGPAFGSTGVLGQSGAHFGQTSFGLGTGSKPAFGQPSGLGGKGFGAFSSTSSGQSSFATGAAAAGGAFSAFSKGSGFSSLASSKPTESPFAQAAGDSPFGKPAQAAGDSPFGNPAQAAGDSPFGNPAQTAGDSPFGKPAQAAGDSPFGKPAQAAGDSPFGKPAQSAFGSPSATSPFATTGALGDSKPAFGLPSGSFSLGSTFKRDEKSAADNEPAPAKPSGSFSLDSSFGNLLRGGPNKVSPTAESMDDSEDVSATPSHEKSSKPLFGQAPASFAPQSPVTVPPETSGLFGTPLQQSTTPVAAQASRSTSFFGGNATATPLSPLSSLSEQTVVPTWNSEREKSVEVPLPPDATSRAVYGPGDTSASSNVSKSSYEDAPLPPDFTQKKTIPKEPIDDAPLPPDFLTKPKDTNEKTTELEEIPLPPDFLSKPKEQKPPAATPLPIKEESISLPHESDGSDGDFEDSGEEVTHDISPPNEPTESESVGFQTSPESSFGGPSLKDSTGGLFTKVTLPQTQPPPQASKPLFGEISQPNIPPPKPRSSAKTPRSPSPVRPGARRGFLRSEQTRSTSAPIGAGAIYGNLGQTPAKFPVSRFEEPLNQSDLIEEEESKAAVAESRRLASESQHLSSDDEDTLRRAELERPLDPAPTLDPFVPRQEYSGESFKPGLPGQIERLYRDINSMVDTLGLNSRSIASYILHEEENRAVDLTEWQETIFSDTPLDILDNKISVSDIENIDNLLVFLGDRLQEQRLKAAHETINECQRLLSHDIFNLRDQCANIQKTLDSYMDTASIRAQPLSAEQAGLQQDLRKTSTAIHSQLTELEQGISLLRARIADSPITKRSLSGRAATKKPTVEAVTSTIATMMNMAESKSSDIDVLEAQMKKLGVNIQSSVSQEASPISTPVKKPGFRVPVTPGSDGGPSAYQTPESVSRFQSSINGSARHSRLRSVNFQLDLLSIQDNDGWKTRTRRRKEIVGNLKRAIGERPVRVRTMDDE